MMYLRYPEFRLHFDDCPAHIWDMEVIRKGYEGLDGFALARLRANFVCNWYLAYIGKFREHINALYNFVVIVWSRARLPRRVQQ